MSQWSVDCGETGSHTALIVYIRPIYLIEYRVTRFYALYTGYRLPYYFLMYRTISLDTVRSGVK